MIYSGRNVDAATKYYYEFYFSLMDFKDLISFIKFEDVVTDMNEVIQKLNEKYSLNLNVSDNIKRDSEVIKNMDVERAKKTRTAEEFIKTVGVPTKERDLLKNEIKQDVNTHLSENSKVTELYEEIISP